MVIHNKTKLVELKRKNHGNKRLLRAVDQFIEDLENGSIMSTDELVEVRRDADRVHSRGFYFFDLHIHRTLVFIQLSANKATVIWAGTHQEYLKTFKNNTNTIEKWLRTRNFLN